MRKCFHLLTLLPFALIFVVLSGCGTAGSVGGGTDKPRYNGYGSGPSATEAIKRAKQDVLSQVVDDLLDGTTRAAHQERLSALFYQTDMPNAYLYLDTLELLSQGKSENTFVASIAIRVNLSAVLDVLVANSIYGGEVMPGETSGVALRDQALPERAATAASSDQNPASTDSEPKQVGVIGTKSDAEQLVLTQYLDDLTFLVYFYEDAAVDPFLMKAAAGIANRYLSEEGINLIDLETVERIKKDQELAYEAQSGRSVSLIQWIAQKLNADIYVEIDAETTAETDGGKYYGQANIALEFFESSTGSLLGSATYRSPKTFSSSSELDALNNAIQSSVYQSMPIVLEQVYAKVRDMAEEGIPFELIVQNTPDARLMRDFIKRLEERVERIEVQSQSADETRYRIFFMGTVGDLQDEVFDVADLIPAFRNLELVYLRGKSITFDSGL